MSRVDKFGRFSSKVKTSPSTPYARVWQPPLLKKIVLSSDEKYADVNFLFLKNVATSTTPDPYDVANITYINQIIEQMEKKLMDQLSSVINEKLEILCREFEKDIKSKLVSRSSG